MLDWYAFRERGVGFMIVLTVPVVLRLGGLRWNGMGCDNVVCNGQKRSS